MHVEFMKIFFSPIRASWWLLDSFCHPEPKNKWFLLCRQDLRRFHENFLLAYSSELTAVRLILASWAQKQVIPTLWTWCTWSSWKIFFSPIPAIWWLLDSFWHAEPKKSDSYFVDRMYVDFMKIFFSPIRASWWLLDSFWHPEPKNKWILLCRNDVRRVHEKFSFGRLERADGC